MAATADITCLCGKHKETVTLKTTIDTHFVCHCNTCRYTTGGPFYTTLTICEQPKTYQDSLKYDTSAKVSRYFCKTCGTHFCHYLNRLKTWHVPKGVVERWPENEQVSPCKPQLIAEHGFVADTIDGGLAVCLTGSSKAPARFSMQLPDGQAVVSLSKESFAAVRSQNTDEDRLRAACHCGGVEFYLSRPNERSRECSSPWPDLLRPYHSHSPANPDDEKWWIRGSTRYFAGTCACRTCRLSNASPITCWAFVPRQNLSKKDGSPLDFDMGTLRSYRSSEGRTRGFCKVCGASVFLRIDERPDLIDISLGLFHAAEGFRAESWFEWCTTRVSFAEEAVEKDMIANLELGLKQIA